MNTKKRIWLGLVISLTLSSCNSKKKTSMKPLSEKNTTANLVQNPLLTESVLPYEAPDFRVIKNKDFEPALEKAMALQTESVEVIKSEKESPAFKNTILALEKSGEKLERVSNVFFALASANTNDSIQEVKERMAPKFAKHSDDIYLNEKLFERVKSIYEKRDTLGLDAESVKLVEEYYKKFVHTGAKLSKENKIKLKEINTQLASLRTRFNQTLLKAGKESKIKVTDKKMLAGLPEEQLESMKAKDGKGWEISLINTVQQPILQSLSNREMRKKIFETSWNRANGGKNNTNELILNIAKLRAEKAALLGDKNYAEWRLQNTMVQNPETVQQFFKQMIPAIVKKASKEAKVLQAMMKKEGINDELKPWDWSYYAEKVRKEKYALEENEIKPYFQLKKILEDGVFYAARKLYGITFKKRTDIPVYHPDIWVYELFNEDGSPIGLFYGDYFARDNKRGGAWMSNFVTQSKLFNKKPVIYNVCNFQKPIAGKPALLSFDDVTTLFHEFGHALHGFFANQQYPMLSGTSVSRDFVEYPSQANEHWALYPEVLKNYAKNYKTGKDIPQSLVDKIKKAATFNQGFAMTEVIAAADLDMHWHTLSETQVSAINDPNVFEKKALTEDHLWSSYIPPRYRSSFFAHIFGGGYAAGYYSYLWTNMLAEDTAEWFDKNGGLKRDLGQRYREKVLSQGNTKEYKAMYRALTGNPPKINALLKAKGLN